jgi:hypothetical protein
MSQKKFKTYFVDGVAKDQEWIVAHTEYLEEELHKDMRSKGYIPVLDIPMKVNWEYDEKSGNFKYRLASKGKAVGCKTAKKHLGILSEQGIVLDINVESAALV